ncbi:MAG: alkaline phosphatase family protein [Prevotella sp.]|nr:alkaline phosphatase family protein [Prevotella sp.]
MRNSYLYITLLAILGFNAETQAQEAVQQPKLVVSICIDGLNSDGLENYTTIYGTGGLRLLMQEGLLFTHATFNFSPVDIASAAAAIATGAPPYYNGITGREWLNRETLRPERMIADSQHGCSPQQLATSTLGDELKMATEGRAKIYAFAPTAEAAILSAGHAANGAAWIERAEWVTSSYYQPADQWLRHFVSRYIPGADENMGVAQAALDCIDQNSIGSDDDADLMCLTMHTGNRTDDYVKLDYALSYLISGVTQKIPLDRVLFVMAGTGKHEENEDERRTNQARYRIPTGKYYINRTVNLLNMYLGAVYGNAQYVETCYQNQIFLNRQLIDKKGLNISDILTRSKEFILQLSGVRNVYTASQLINSDSQLLQRIRNGFNQEHCGDLLIEVAPGWELINEDMNTSQITHMAVLPLPIIFYGSHVKSQRVATPVTTDRIAPTIARCIRIRAPNACQAEPLF